MTNFLSGPVLYPSGRFPPNDWHFSALSARPRRMFCESCRL
ncbi:hypothetical protein 2203_scaffold802_00105 [Bacteriophage sp.]|nr:hypothetical protein 2203_scaffold802_00105 [Bacteriophage sp.]